MSQSWEVLKVAKSDKGLAYECHVLRWMPAVGQLRTRSASSQSGPTARQTVDRSDLSSGSIRAANRKGAAINRALPAAQSFHDASKPSGTRRAPQAADRMYSRLASRSRQNLTADNVTAANAIPTKKYRPSVHEVARNRGVPAGGVMRERLKRRLLFAPARKKSHMREWLDRSFCRVRMAYRAQRDS